MKLCLGLIVRDEEVMLSKYLPKLSECFNGEVVAINYESTDKTEDILRKYCKYVHNDRWSDNFGGAKTQLIQLAEKAGYDWLFVIDADENVLPADIELMKQCIQENDYTAYFIPRIGFTEENLIEADLLYFPDLQTRLFKLNMGYEYRSPTHCSLYRAGETKSVWELGGGAVMPIFIRHYKGMRPKEDQIKSIQERHAVVKSLEPITPLIIKI